MSVVMIPVLHDAVVLASRLDHLSAFPEIVGDRLFDIHVFARLASPDRNQCMPVIGGCRGDGVDTLVFEQLANVGMTGDLLATVARPLQFTIEHVLIDIADGHHADAGQFAEQAQVKASLTAKSHDRDSDVVVGSQRTGTRRHGESRG